MRIMDILRLQAGDTKPVNRKVVRHGLSITIEHPKGTFRVLHDDRGVVVYKKLMSSDYGYFNGTKGRDGDEVDVMVGPMENAKEVYVVHMTDKGPRVDEREDEDKCLIGYPSATAAKAAFLAHYPRDFYSGMTCLPVETFKKQLATASLPYRRKKITAGGPGSGRRKEQLLDYEVHGPSGVRAVRGKRAEAIAYAKALGPGHEVHARYGYRNGAWELKPPTETVRRVRIWPKSSEVTATATKCPRCGSSNYVLMPSDFESAKCKKCGKVWERGIVSVNGVTMTKKEFVREHKRLVPILRRGTKRERNREADDQAEELQEVCK